MEIKKPLIELRNALRTAKGRNILTFLIFLAISTVFWFLLALNDDVQDNYALPVTLDSFPENVTILSGYNPELNLTVKDKGSSLMKFSWGHNPSMKIRYDEFSRPNDTTLLLNSAQLNSAVRSVFGTSATIVSMRPDSLKLIYTTNPGIRVAVNVLSDVRTLPQYAYAGHPIVSDDSVTLFSNSPKRFKIHSIPTQMITLDQLTDTTAMDVKLDVPAGMRVMPPSVKVTFPVEPLVAKQQSVPIEVTNTPPGVRVVTFPAMTEISYLIPKSMYATEAAGMKATVDYNAITPETKSLPILLPKLPSHYRGISASPSKVEFVIEQTD